MQGNFWKSRLVGLLMLSALFVGMAARPAAAQSGYMPDETALHEGTWLQWPHHFTYGTSYRNQIEPTWVEMTRVLVQSERVHIVAYNSVEVTRIKNRLKSARVPLTRVDFLIRPTNDVWVRDNGPIFVRDFTNGGRLTVSDFGFNGWGFDAPYALDETVPIAVASSRALPRWNFNDLVLEGGSIEVDGGGVLMATRSSILERDRNPDWTQAEVEFYLRETLGISKFVWLDGAPGGTDDITDTHIDGFARFALPDTIVTMSATDLRYWGISDADITRLNSATDVDDIPYRRVLLPLTRNNVRTTSGANLGYKGSYVNFYVSNGHVLMPTYNDPNDAVAKATLQQIFPNRTVVGIDCRNLYSYGGMIHCVTQQQPAE